MSILEKIIAHLEEVKESSISEMTLIGLELDRNRLSSFLCACEESEIVENVGKGSHRKYQLRSNYLEKLKDFQFRVTLIINSSKKEKWWNFPYKTQLKHRKIELKDEIPEKN